MVESVEHKGALHGFAFDSSTEQTSSRRSGERNKESGEAKVELVRERGQLLVNNRLMVIARW